MSVLELLIGVVFVLGASVGFGMTPAATTSAEFWIARVAFAIAAMALCAGYFDWLHEGDRPAGLRVLLGVLVGVLSIAGTAETLAWINTREAKSNSDRTAMPEADYSHTLAFAGLQPSLDLKNEHNRLEVRVVLANKGDRPVHYRMDKLEMTFGSYRVETHVPRSFLVAKGDTSVFFPDGGLTAAQYRSLPERPVGHLDMVIDYGKPDADFARRLSLSLRLDLFKQNPGHPNENASLNWVIRDQHEEPIGKPPTSIPGVPTR